MPETFVPPADNLVIMSLNGTNGFFGVICGQLEAEELLVYNLQLKSTHKLHLRQCIPFTPDNYQSMCMMSLWEGIIVRMPNGFLMKAHEGKMFGALKPECRLLLGNVGGEHHQDFWVPLRDITPVGHVSATNS